MVKIRRLVVSQPLCEPDSLPGARAWVLASGRAALARRSASRVSGSLSGRVRGDPTHWDIAMQSLELLGITMIS